ncbi:FUSC family protein [Ignatzschineria cameli]|uniref:FUSC family protein n=1 Tax=Ignatzschineria cameli TaxID=2182793 RepID=UPI000D60E9B4|nr:FUSC family protein [Ignatzschineria cameli]PWD87273.1 FUSC family protein [Ignatzschineria cameli]
MIKKVTNFLKEAIAVNNRPWPWERAIGAGVAMTLPILIGIWLGQLQYGLIAGLGGFTYLYAFPIPYAQLSKRLLFVALTIVTCSFLGSLLSPYPLAVAIVMGLIAGISLFIFNALRFIGPSAIFFVLIFALTADMSETDFAGALTRAGLVSLGALLSWIIAMSGFLLNPHRPEIRAIRRAYQQLITLSESIGTIQFQEEKYKTMGVFKESFDTLIAGELPWQPSETYRRLLHLAIEGNEYFLTILNNYSDESRPIDPEVIRYLKTIEAGINHKFLAKRDRNNYKNKGAMKEEKRDSSLLLPMLPASMTKITSYLERMEQALHASLTELQPVTLESKTKVKDLLVNAFDQNSLVFLTAIRFSIVTTIAALIAYSFDFTRSYWIPLSCVAVMSGESMIATLHRAIQRSIGTFIGIIIASSILYFKPSGYPVALFILFFTATIELFIVRNYGLAVIFITPNALLLAETITGGEFSFFHFSGARMIDVVIGSSIGIIGVLLMGKRSASVRIPRILMRTLRNQSQMILLLFSQKKVSTEKQIQARLIKMRTNLNNLMALYNAAIGEIPKKRELLEYYWPIIYSMEKLAFLLERATERSSRPILKEQDLASLLFLFETLANAAQYSEIEEIKSIPKIEGFDSIQREIDTLQQAFAYKQPLEKSITS